MKDFQILLKRLLQFEALNSGRNIELSISSQLQFIKDLTFSIFSIPQSRFL